MTIYRVWKYTKNHTYDYGNLPEEDVKDILKYCKYDEAYGLWFTKKAAIAYEVKEVQ